ncbi:hypothetical protein ACWG8W_07520 [Citricoccus zhacaiensis]
MLGTIAGPATGAVIALIGVLIGLTVTGFRARRESRLSREDALRAEQRRVLAELLAQGMSYRRLGEVLSDPSQWAKTEYGRATALFEDTEEAMAVFQQRFVTARLLIDERPLVDALDALFEANHAVAEVIHEALDSSFTQRKPSSVILRRDFLWQEFSEAITRLQATAIVELRPTIRSGIRSRRRRKSSTKP